MYKLEFSRIARKIYSKLPKDLQQVLDAKLKKLAESPYNQEHDIKKLQGFDNSYRLRIGHWRLIYEIHNERLLLKIIKIGLRKEVYR